MNNTLIFIRHAEAKKDKDLLPEDWVLTDVGEKEAQRLADSGSFDDVDVFISSAETKSCLTIVPIAKKKNQRIIRMPELNEMKRGKEYLDEKEFKGLKQDMLNNLDSYIDGGETSMQALKRFKKALSLIDGQYENKKILIASHGTVLSLYFADLLGKLDQVYERWKHLSYCNWGVVKNGVVEKDIIN